MEILGLLLVFGLGYICCKGDAEGKKRVDHNAYVEQEMDKIRLEREKK